MIMITPFTHDKDTTTLIPMCMYNIFTLKCDFSNLKPTSLAVNRCLNDKGIFILFIHSFIHSYSRTCLCPY